MSDEDPVVVRHRGVLGGRPVFRGTRCQAELLFENLAEGYSLDEIVEAFPTLDRDDLRTALRQSMTMLMDTAPDVTPLDAEASKREETGLVAAR